MTRAEGYGIVHHRGELGLEVKRPVITPGPRPSRRRLAEDQLLTVATKLQTATAL